MVKRLTADIANSLWKVNLNGVEDCVHNALIELSENAYYEAEKLYNSNLPDDFLIINGRYYVIGERAERYGVFRPLMGAAKYVKEFMGIAVAAMAARLLEMSSDLVVYVAYPPGNLAYLDQLEDSILSHYDVTVCNRTVHINITHVYEFCEAVGGCMNILLTEKGSLYKNLPISEGELVAIDIGGGTTDICGVFYNGELDTSMRDSFDIGINHIYKNLGESLKNQYAKLLLGSDGLSMRKLRTVLKTGILELKGRSYDCHETVQAEKNRYFNRLRNSYYQTAKGGADASGIVLTGAGYVDIFNDIVPILEFDPDRIFKAGDDAVAHYSNVRGGLKLLYMFESTGIITYD